MRDELDEKAPESFDMERWLGVARRRYLHFLIPLLFGWMIIWGASWVIPPVYRSGTLILVEQPTMPKDYVTPNVSDDLQERLQSITQQILSRTRLLQIIDQVKLYNAKADAKLTPDDKVERMRKDIEIELVRDARNDKITAFNVYYSARDPHLAQQVTSELTNLFINENVEVRQQLSEDTTQFLETQLETARNALAEQEEKIREFKGQHVGEMPEQQQSNLQILSGLQSQLQSAEDALTTAKQQRIYLQTLIDQYRTLQATASSGGGAPESLPAIDKELERLRGQLADLTSRYTSRHPDVRKLKEQIAQTEKTRQALIADLAKNTTTTEDPLKPKVSELTPNSPMMQLQGQLQTNQSEIASRERAIAGLKVSIGEYQARLNQEPVREQQLADLTRGYDQSKANYDELLKKKNQSEMATSMERLQQGERFRVLDPAGLPLKPDFPNRLKFCGMGLGAGLILGLFVAGGCEFMDGRMHSEKEIKELLPVGVMVEIPEILNFSDQEKSKRKAWLRWVTAGVVIATILAGSAFSYLHG